MTKKLETPIPQLWNDEGFSLFKDFDGGYNLREVIDHLGKLAPYLSELDKIEERVSEYINAGVVNGLQDYLKDPLIALCYHNENDAGKILVDFYDQGPPEVGHRTVDLQSEVDEMASGSLTEPEVMEAWAVWFENAAKKIRAGINPE